MFMRLFPSSSSDFPHLTSVALVLITVVVVSTAGCGGSTTETPTPTQTQTDASTDLTTHPDASDATTGHDAQTALDAADSATDASDEAATEAGSDAAPACQPLGATRCNANTVETCSDDGSGGQNWTTTKFCSPDTEQCRVQNNVASCVANPTCKDGLRNQDESDVDCGGTKCAPCAAGLTCSQPSDCASDACDNGICQLCKADTIVCHGNRVDKCNSDQSSWTNLSKCNALGGQLCDANTGTCIASKPIGGGPSTATGTYYRFARFTMANSEFKGGADVDSKGDEIYVNRDGAHVDVYRVTLIDSDGDGKMEPNQHPDNPKATGPIEERKLTWIKTYDVPIGNVNNNELFITDHGTIAFTKGYTADDGDIFEYDMGKSVTTKLIDSPKAFWSQTLGYDEVSGKWYSGPPYQRRIYSYDPNDPQSPEWVLEFTYPSFSGDHADGLEVVVDPNTSTTYVYVSDMTSNYIGQYVKKSDGWHQQNLFKYNDTNADDVEGMGFGALHHFWITNNGYGGSHVQTLYEVGGGSLQDYVEPS